MEGLMTSMSLRVLLIAGAALAVGACNKTATGTDKTATAETNTTTTAAASNDPVASAESAAPAALAHDAAIVTASADGKMNQLRAG
jgi:predicted alpha/beta hydrolase family esterase